MTEQWVCPEPGWYQVRAGYSPPPEHREPGDALVLRRDYLEIIKTGDNHDGEQIVHLVVNPSRLEGGL